MLEALSQYCQYCAWVAGQNTSYSIFTNWAEFVSALLYLATGTDLLKERSNVVFSRRDIDVKPLNSLSVFCVIVIQNPLKSAAFEALLKNHARKLVKIHIKLVI